MEDAILGAALMTIRALRRENKRKVKRLGLKHKDFHFLRANTYVLVHFAK